MGAHGFPRATKDVDIVPAPNEGNLDRLANVLRVIEAHNFGTGDFDPAEFPFDLLNPDDDILAQLAGSAMAVAAFIRDP